MIIQLKFANETDTLAAMKTMRPTTCQKTTAVKKLKFTYRLPSVKPEDELRCPYCGGTAISSDSAGHCCMDCYGEF